MKIERILMLPTIVSGTSAMKATHLEEPPSIAGKANITTTRPGIAKQAVPKCIKLRCPYVNSQVNSGARLTAPESRAKRPTSNKHLCAISVAFREYAY